MAASEDQEDLSYLLYGPAPGEFSGPTEHLAVSSLPGCDKQMKPGSLSHLRSPDGLQLHKGPFLLWSPLCLF